MSRLQLMVDLETFGTGPNAAIASIGAVAFDPQDVRDPVFGSREELTALGRTFHLGIEFRRTATSDAQRKLLGDFDGATVMWWLSQPEEAQHALEVLPKAGFSAALLAFSNWHANQGAEEMWSNGPLFDEAILRSAFNRAELPFPIHYRGTRCFRTLMATGESLVPSFKARMKRLKVDDVGPKHDALADSIQQARAVISAYDMMHERSTK